MKNNKKIKKIKKVIKKIKAHIELVESFSYKVYNMELPVNVLEGIDYFMKKINIAYDQLLSFLNDCSENNLNINNYRLVDYIKKLYVIKNNGEQNEIKR